MLFLIILLIGHFQENGKIIKTGDSSIATQINEGGFKSIALV
jgi:Fe-S cluster assembly ATP-binding protein